MVKSVTGKAREHKAEKRRQAELRQFNRSMRTDREQLAILQERGHGHCDEATYLIEKIMREEELAK